MARLNEERQKELEPQRRDYAKTKIQDLDYEIIEEDDSKIVFMFNGKPVTLFIYSGWHTGKSIRDGRGINNLLKQIKKH